MDKEEQEFLTEKPTRSKRRNEDKMNKTLNILIGVVAMCIVIVLVVIFTSGDSAPEQAEPIEPVEEQLVPEQESPTEEIITETPVEEELAEQELAEQENMVVQSDDATVTEVWTNESWTPYPTAQTGAHTSTYQTGHIDYEEKLKAFYSVIPLEQDSSIVWTVKNNGSPTTAVAVLVSNDKSEMYRVSIEWVEAQGWLPVQVEVLNTLP